MFVVKRSQENPILGPQKNHHWEASATFNIFVVSAGWHLHGLSRAVSNKDPLRSPEQISTIGIAKSLGGLHFKDHKQFIEPLEEREKIGCEDPRVTFFEGRY